MQEEVESRTVNLAVSTTKLSARTIVSAVRAYLNHRKNVAVKKEHNAEKTPEGKQTVKELISHNPGPEVGDINTMHRYRDAIVYQNGGSPYERTMFGAYVLFPYSNEEDYQHHRFYESIGKVNIGGLPFLPSAMSLVSQMLDELISDSPESAFERATLPRGIEAKLQKVDWNTRDGWCRN